VSAYTPITIERISPDDLTHLACDVGPAPMQVAAVLVLDGGAKLAPSTVVEAIADRVSTVPRLRQRLVRLPMGYGRPIWADDPLFDVRRHVHCVHCPAPGDERAMLTIAAAAATRGLPADRPLWSITLVTGMAHGAAALVVVLHHVVADGIAGLAILANLVDGAPPTSRCDLPRPEPSPRRLFADAVRAHLRTVATLPATMRRLRSAAAVLRPAGTAPAPACSLNQPTGGRRELASVRVDLAAVRAAGRAYGGTVNDVLLTAVAGALRALLHNRGEGVDRLVVSVPASARRSTGSASLGNQVGVIPIAVPTGGEPLRRLRTIAGITRTRKDAPRGATTSLLGPAFRALARVGLFGWFINHQRQVNTFLTNLRGPEQRLSFLGTPISDIHPVTVVPGNVSVAFAALSYAGTLTVTIIADPDLCPDLPALTRHLRGELATLVSATPILWRAGE
jgi:diacylglycerol O-acyltransferase